MAFPSDPAPGLFTLPARLVLLGIILSMAGWWNIQQNTRLTLIEERHYALAKSVYEHALLNETFKKNDAALQEMAANFRVAVERMTAAGSSALELKAVVQALETQHRSLREIVLRLEQQLALVVEPLQQRQGR